ncbi:hypothetical protein [Altererythrobacter sp. MTPC7]|uniref:hypothetical protein n=1 Tax=Altererythrobacter sp. MTPC7 TaxID=3056567 RepID=UPI0036F1B2D3
MAACLTQPGAGGQGAQRATKQFSYTDFTCHEVAMDEARFPFLPRDVSTSPESGFHRHVRHLKRHIAILQCRLCQLRTGRHALAEAIPVALGPAPVAMTRSFW